MPGQERVDNGDAVPDRSSLLSAYQAGRNDERVRVEKDPIDTGTGKRRWRDAYPRGRLDERARRRRSPLLSLLILIVAAAGGALVYLAASQGSFSRGGEVVDRAMGHAA